MEMPTPCPGCGNVVEFNDMLNHPNEFKTMVCEECHDRIEEENNRGEQTDNFGNKLEWIANPDDGLIDFKVNGEPITTWSYEDEPELAFIEFLSIWNKAQEIAKGRLNDTNIQLEYSENKVKELEHKTFKTFNDEECWLYDEDHPEENHLESLVCPVVVRAGFLIDLLKERDQLAVIVASYRKIVDEISQPFMSGTSVDYIAGVRSCVTQLEDIWLGDPAELTAKIRAQAIESINVVEFTSMALRHVDVSGDFDHQDIKDAFIYIAAEIRNQAKDDE